MRRRLVGALVCSVSGLLIPLSSFAQSPSKVWRIGILNPRAARTMGPESAYAEFFAGLRDLGYAEERNMTVVWQFANGKLERLPELAAQLVRDKVDVIVTHSTHGVSAAKQATSTIPIVALTFGDPVGSGFAASLARPGGNITGVTTLGEEIVAKRMQILSSAVPRASRIAYLTNPDNPIQARIVIPNLVTAARRAGKDIVVVRVRSAEELSEAFEVMGRERVGALLVSDDPVFSDLGQRIGTLALQRKLPVMFPNAADFGTMSYGRDMADMGRRAATLAAKILNGAKPGDLPIEQPTKFNLVVNLKMAKAIGVAIPESILVQANRVIE
jgi:putative ABC transport system substrate-binding protein